ncbi:MAG TPA: hypothetical protein VNN10_12875 [Dehalococcoidia bacterium]|nr:hypothetical protein [Dehalococcoidia bacterium]
MRPRPHGARPGAPKTYPAAVRWLARLALLTLALQLASLGHWSVGPFHQDPGALESHAAHCHGDTSACGGQPAFAGTYVERPLTLVISSVQLEVEQEAAASPRSAVLPIPEQPPRRA